jgi:putative transcriptional regulator
MEIDPILTKLRNFRNFQQWSSSEIQRKLKRIFANTAYRLSRPNLHSTILLRWILRTNLRKSFGPFYWELRKESYSLLFTPSVHPRRGSFRPEGQTSMSKIDTITRIFPDGRRIKTHADGRVEELSRLEVVPVDAPLDDELESGLSAERLAKLKLSPRSKTLRRALGLTQEEFAARYRIPIGTLRDWDQGRTEPDATSRAYLHVIAKNPEMVMQALAS